MYYNNIDAVPGTVKLVKGQGEKFGECASKAKPLSGYTDVIIHGNPGTDKVAVFHNGEWKVFKPKKGGN